MNKAYLKQKWSKYCDTDKLVDDMMETLTKYRHRNSEHGVCVVLDTYFTNKEPLINMFMNSNHYVGDMRIVAKKGIGFDGFDRRFPLRIQRSRGLAACSTHRPPLGFDRRERHRGFGLQIGQYKLLRYARYRGRGFGRRVGSRGAPHKFLLPFGV